MARNRRWTGIALALSALCGCEIIGAPMPPALLVTLYGVPQEAATLQPAVAGNQDAPETLSGWHMAAPIAPQDLRPLRAEATQQDPPVKLDRVALDLQLPDNLSYQWLSVGVRLQDAQGHLVGAASTQLFLSSNNEVGVPVWDNVRDSRDQRPLLALADPATLTTAAQPPQVTLFGWGLTPDLAVEIGGQPADLTWISVTQVIARLSAAPPPGPVTVLITTADGQDQRADLLTVQ